MPLLDPSGIVADRWAGETRLDVANDADVGALPLDGVRLVVVPFPKFSDGRGFSIARQLRAAGYCGRLRAAGELIPDQFAFALDCGFDEMEISEERLARQPVDQWLDALASMSASYQPSPRPVVTIFERRRAARGLA